MCQYPPYAPCPPQRSQPEHPYPKLGLSACDAITSVVAAEASSCGFASVVLLGSDGKVVCFCSAWGESIAADARFVAFKVLWMIAEAERQRWFCRDGWLFQARCVSLILNDILPASRCRL